MILKSTLQDIGLKTADIDKIHQVFRSYPEIQKAILFGSRAKGNFKPFSDIDITLVGVELNLTIQQRIENELEDLLIPYKFDLSIFDRIESAELVEHIKRVGKEFYTI